MDDLRRDITRTRSRREFLKLTGGGLTALALASCAPGTGGAATGSAAVDYSKTSTSLIFYHYTGSNQEIVPHEVALQYMKDFPNVTVTELSGGAEQFAKRVASFKTTGDPGVNVGYYNVEESSGGDLVGLWLPLNPQRIPNMKDIAPSSTRPDNMGIGWGFSPIGISYRTDKINPAPTSWLDLLDPKYKGHVAIADAPLYSFNGFMAINRVLGGTEKDASPGFKAFSDAAKAGQFHSTFPGRGQLQQLYNEGQVWMAAYTKSIVAPFAEAGMPIGYAVPKEGQIGLPLYLQILKGSSPAQIFHSEEIINRLLSPDILSRYCELTSSAPANTKVKLPAKLANDPAYSAAELAHLIPIDWISYNQALDTWNDRWNREVKANLK